MLRIWNGMDVSSDFEMERNRVWPLIDVLGNESIGGHTKGKMHVEAIYALT